jgi:hypothetical protein
VGRSATGKRPGSAGLQNGTASPANLPSIFLVYRSFPDHKKIALRFSVAGNVARAFSKNPMFSLVGVNYGRKFLACLIAPNCVELRQK